ncbi:M23 family metallopeptidase [Otoolea muris]|uniref:M23 family metallopeptidase n=1 Tax=Otoolea muris TaxID=2941515 RepID=UPI0020422139|nr:M23 family metallopeptidase [Otoolea muris]
MKNKINQLFKDKLLLVMMVLGLLTIVAAAGAVRIRRGNPQNDQNPYLEVPETQGLLAKEPPAAVLPEKEKEKETKEAQAGTAKAAGSSDADYSTENKAAATKETGAERAEKANASRAVPLNYNGADKLGWPVRGNVILDFSMETTTYFPTLDQYKCNPALIIQGEVSDPVSAPADAMVLEVGANEEIGNFVVLDLGGEYTAVCGQLKDIQVAKNQYVSQGSKIGYVSEPTKYYSVEGTNVYFELKHEDKPVDALDYLE